MKFPTLKTVVGFLEWRGREEDYDAQFLEECAREFRAHRKPLLHKARIYKQRAQNIRANLALLRSLGIV
jgi:hypothetical protein